MKNTVTRTLIATAFAFLAFAAVSHAEQDIFFCTPAAKGYSGDGQFGGCARLIAVGEQIRRPVDDGSGTTRQRGTAELGPIQMFKDFDAVSVALRKLALRGIVFDAQIYFRDGNSQVYLTMELADVVVQSIGMDARPEGAAEAVELSARRVTWRYDYGKAGSDEYSWDFEIGG